MLTTSPEFEGFLIVAPRRRNNDKDRLYKDPPDVPSGGDEHDDDPLGDWGDPPDDTRPILWVFMQKNTKVLDANLKALNNAIEHQARAIEERAKSDALTRRYEARVGGGLALFLILGMFAAFGLNVTAKVLGNEFTTAHSGP